MYFYETEKCQTRNYKSLLSRVFLHPGIQGRYKEISLYKGFCLRFISKPLLPSIFLGLGMT